MVCIPFFADQGYNSWIVENLRVGRRLWHRNVSPDTISEAVQDILTNADYLCAAQEIRDDLLRNDGGEAVARYVAEICDLRDLSEKSRLRGDGG
jgi:UDP:flavonoid glycosyltransferase YjiC (YdhE family)